MTEVAGDRKEISTLHEEGGGDGGDGQKRREGGGEGSEGGNSSFSFLGSWNLFQVFDLKDLVPQSTCICNLR